MCPAGECSTQWLSRVLCCRLCLTFATKTRHGKKWPDTHRFPPGRLARPERHGRSTCCCSGLPLLLDSIALHPRTCACLYIYGLHMSSDPTSPYDLPVSGRLAGGFAEMRHWSYYTPQVMKLLLRLFTCVQPMGRDHLACLARPAHWISWCDTGGPPGELEGPAGAKRTDGPGPRLSAGSMAHPTPLPGQPGSVCSAAPPAQPSPEHGQAFTHSALHSPASRREARLCSVTGPNTISAHTVKASAFPIPSVGGSGPCADGWVYK